MPKSREQNNSLQEIIGKSENKDTLDVEVVLSPELKSLSNTLNEVQEAIDTDQDLKAEDLLSLKEAVGKIKVEIAGEEFALEEIASNGELQKNIKIWKEIEVGKLDNTYKITLITSKIAEILLDKCKQKRHISLSDLTSLSNKVAEILSRFEGHLDLRGLTSLSKEVAENLSKHKGDLNLSGLISLSTEVAKFLGKQKGGVLYLSGLTSLSAEVAEALSKYEGSLWLTGLSSLSDEVAEALSKHEGNLNLARVTSLSAEVAEALSKHKGDIQLTRVTSLSDEVAEALSKHEGNLNLYYLTSISDVAAKALSKHKGDLNLPDEGEIKKLVDNFKII
jgi:hypothetical protein